MINGTNGNHLRLLWWLRNLAILGQAAAISLAGGWLGIPLHSVPMWVVVALQLLLNAYTHLRLANGRPVTAGELLMHLLADVLALFCLLYFSGGASNPFASLFILQVVIAAIALPPVYAWMVAGLTITLYTGLLFSAGMAQGMHAHEHAHSFTAHIQGMWISFVLLALLTAGFVARIGAIMRRQEQLLAEADQISALGTLAAGAAHELGTPLSTIAVLAGEYRDEAKDEAQRDRAGTLCLQVRRCKDILSQITAGAGVMRAVQGQAQPLDDFLRAVLADWRMLRPSARVDTEFTGPLPAPRIVAELSLKQAITSLLDNAADASPAAITVTGEWTPAALRLRICDRGDGIPGQLEGAIGNLGATTKPEGMGLGLYLARNVIDRLGGALTLHNGATGAVATITLPLARVLV